MRSWRNALDNIYYHNAYRVPANYRPKNETERALQESLSDMEKQCKERVDLLEALRNSREEGSKDSNTTNGHEQGQRAPWSTSQPAAKSQPGALGQGTIPAVNYPEIARPTRPTLPPRPSVPKSNESTSLKPDQLRSVGSSQSPYESKSNLSSSSLPPTARMSSRTPSPEKRSSGGLFKTTLRPAPRESRSSFNKLAPSMRTRPPAAAKAATLAWPGAGQSSELSIGGSGLQNPPKHSNVKPTNPSDSLPQNTPNLDPPRKPIPAREVKPNPRKTSHGKPFFVEGNGDKRSNMDYAPSPTPQRPRDKPVQKATNAAEPNGSLPGVSAPSFPSYRKEYPVTATIDAPKAQYMAARMNANLDESLRREDKSRQRPSSPRKRPPPVPRKEVGSPRAQRSAKDYMSSKINQASSSESENEENQARRNLKSNTEVSVTTAVAEEDPMSSNPQHTEWDRRVKHLMKNLPKGVDEHAAKAIFNEIVIKGDEVHWDDVAGLDIAKGALKEAVVYPFLRPDLFMGLREPARGMLLFGPPGTGKTMLARAVATESKSTFFAISASSLTSKFLGESEKLVRALFAIAKSLTPSIIFVDEIDSLLSARAGSGEHEATRRIKTEFLIQWSDLAKAAAGREDKDRTQGDASRVLVLAATNMPWAIDEAARRRFVRRQYIPLPESHVRESQLRRLMGAQKHGLRNSDFAVLVELTDGKSEISCAFIASVN